MAKFDVHVHAKAHGGNQGPRTFEIITGDNPEYDPKNKKKGVAPLDVETVIVAPGETKTLDLVDPDHKVLKAWIDAGEVSLNPPTGEAYAPVPLV